MCNLLPRFRRPRGLAERGRAVAQPCVAPAMHAAWHSNSGRREDLAQVSGRRGEGRVDLRAAWHFCSACLAPGTPGQRAP
eukprot:8596672-Pyramimonas_sp.AAC.1